MTKNEYNGYYNYETWNISLWIDNEQSSQEYWAERAREALENAIQNRASEQIASLPPEDRAAINLADALKDEHEESLPELTGFAADLLNAAMSEVNWHEIAKNLVEAAKEAA